MPPASRNQAARLVVALASLLAIGVADAHARDRSHGLGPTYQNDRIRLRLWTPWAKRVNAVVEGHQLPMPMRRQRGGVWELVVPGSAREHLGRSYHFVVDGKRVSDPYAELTGDDYGPARFVDLASLPKVREVKTDVAELLRRGLYEAHPKGFTRLAAIDPAIRGTYLGLADPAITGHLVELGIGGLELLPMAQGDRHSALPADHPEGLDTNYWNYMTTHYGAPHIGYAADPARAPLEVKTAVSALHDAGIAVGADVVYNHTAMRRQVPLRRIARHYYYRYGPDGKRLNGSGTGNELATERTMVRRMMTDTVGRWVDDYGVDFLRFDLAALIRKQDLMWMRRDLSRHLQLVVGEPWAWDHGRMQWGKGDLNGFGAVWNDDYRNAAWEFLLAKDPGRFGAAREQMIRGVAGSIHPDGFARSPLDTVNIIETHDEPAVADVVGGDKRRALMAIVLQVTSQGFFMLREGQEFMGGKGGLKNTYNRDDEVNWVDWSLKEKNRDFYDATRRLLALRRGGTNFLYERQLTPADVRWYRERNGAALAYLVRPSRRDGQADVLVLLNPHPSDWAHFELPRDGTWKVEVDGDVDARGRIDARGPRSIRGPSYAVPPGVAVVLSQVAPAGWWDGPASEAWR